MSYDDRDKCQFYYKIGACRHGDRCSKKHQRPTHSQTIILSNLWRNPDLDDDNKQSREEIDADFLAFFEDIFVEAGLLGQISTMVVCENHNDHLSGNVYIKFTTEKAAADALENFNMRWYDQRPVYCDLSHITDFRDAVCREHDTTGCARGNQCNFMHLKRPPTQFVKDLHASQRKYRAEHPVA